MKHVFQMIGCLPEHKIGASTHRKSLKKPISPVREISLVKRLLYLVLVPTVGVPAAVLAASGKIGNNPLSDATVMLLAGVALVYLARIGRKIFVTKS